MKNRSKIIIAVLLIVIVAVVLLFVFKPFKADNNIENNVNDNDVAKEYVDIRYEAHVMESSILSENQNMVISSHEELLQYTDSLEDTQLSDMLKGYDEEYFMGKALIIAIVRDDLEMDPVKNVSKEINSNVINISLDARELEEFVTPNMVTNNIVIEVNSEDVQDINGLEVKMME